MSYTTLQFHRGGLFDAEPCDEAIHLVPQTELGTSPVTLCGIDRGVPDGPGFSVGGGISGGSHRHHACPGCVSHRDPDEVVFGMFAGLFASPYFRSATGSEAVPAGAPSDSTVREVLREALGHVYTLPSVADAEALNDALTDLGWRVVPGEGA